MNRDISVRLRLKLFQAVVSPTVLFGLTTLPLTTCQKHQLDAVQRRMLRSIVGWAKPVDGEWATAMRQTNARLKSALSLFPIDNWMYQLAGRIEVGPQIDNKSSRLVNQIPSLEPL